MHAITPRTSATADASPPVMRQRLGRAVTQWSVTKAEWIKLRSVRVNVVGIAAAAVGWCCSACCSPRWLQRTWGRAGPRRTRCRSPSGAPASAS